jgi:hypothetical protein
MLRLLPFLAAVHASSPGGNAQNGAFVKTIDQQWGGTAEMSSTFLAAERRRAQATQPPTDGVVVVTATVRCSSRDYSDCH